MKKPKILTLLALLALCSCDPVGQKNFYIQNDSHSKVYWYRNPTKTLSDSVAAGEKKLMHEIGGMSGADDIPTKVGGVIEATLVTRITNDTLADLKRDYSTLSNWQSQKLSKRNFDYTLQITDLDF